MPILSLLISIFSDRTEQFEMSLASLTSHPYNSHLIELLIFVDYLENKPILNILKRYRKYFSSIKVFVVTNKLFPVNHSATRRNFLVSQARGRYIIFSEPEIFHINNSIQYFLSHAQNKETNTWICGPVYATKDLVKPNGELVDSSKPLKNFKHILNIPNNINILKNREFKKNYHLINYQWYLAPFYCTMLNRNYFLSLKGLNQALKVRGFEEFEFYKRFSKNGGRIIIDKNIKTIHLPHKKSLDKESQISWNLYNSTVTFNNSQTVGEIINTKYKTINLV
jgi:hypothetical protein